MSASLLRVVPSPAGNPSRRFARAARAGEHFSPLLTCPCRPAHCRADSERAAPSRRHTKARTALCKSRVDQQEHDAEHERVIHSFGLWSHVKNLLAPPSEGLSVWPHPPGLARRAAERGWPCMTRGVEMRHDCAARRGGPSSPPSYGANNGACRKATHRARGAPQGAPPAPRSPTARSPGRMMIRRGMPRGHAPLV